MAKHKLKIGDKAKDGWTYMGHSPDTHKPMFVAPEDAGLMTLDDAENAARFLRKRGKAEARVPSKGELRKIFNHLATVEGLDTAGAYAGGVYWSSSACGAHGAVALRAADGQQLSGTKTATVLLARLVRS